MEEFNVYFREIGDPRASNARHDLLELIFVALAAVLCGAEDCTDMAAFARAKLGVLQQVVGLKHGPPSHDTFSRVFRLLDPEPFEAAFARFTMAFAGALEGVVAIDGKALRGAYERGRKTTPLHLVNVWAAEKRLVIGQRLAPGRNEVAGVLEVLALLRLDGCIVTADALHCRADTARAILETGADYALALKENHPKLLARARALVEAAPSRDTAAVRSSCGHDRIERRRAVVVAAENLDFPGIAAIGQIESERSVAGNAEPPVLRWFLLSRPVSAAQMLKIARAHWTIENQLHWVLDVSLAEDAARSRKDNAPQNLALIRKLALNILRAHPEKGSIKGKIKRAGWNDDFLLSLLAHMR
jgi:predicted transposase YbfD/YdcC